MDDLAVKAPPQIPRALFTRADKLLEGGKPVEWVVPGIIPRQSLIGAVGPSGTCKTLLAIDIGAATATGLPWNGLASRMGPVFFLAGEGLQQFGKRLRAWTVDRSVSLTGKPLFVSSRMPALASDATAWATVVEEIDTMSQQFDAQPELVVVDTVARALCGADENSASDVGRFIASMDAIRDRFGCAVLAIHHTGHNEARARGSSAFFAALDGELQFRRSDQTISVVGTKAKDWAMPPAMAFQPRIVDIDVMGADGHPETSVVLVPSDPEADVRAVQKQQAQELRSQGKSIREIASILHVPKSTVDSWL